MSRLIIDRFSPSARGILEAALTIAEHPGVDEVLVREQIPDGKQVFGNAVFEGARAKDFRRALSYLQDFAGRRKLLPQVFLGGACGSSTWRQDIAIPILKVNHVDFYNPQIEDWDDQDAFYKANGIAGGILEVESKNKLESQVLLFVFDQNTRGLASLNEVVEFMVSAKQQVVIVEAYLPTDRPVEVSGQVLTSAEIQDINVARSILFGYARAKDVPVFQTVADACVHAACLLKEKDVHLTFEECHDR